MNSNSGLIVILGVAFASTKGVRKVLQDAERGAFVEEDWRE